MALLKWDERYRLGLDAVDYEHRELIELINRLHDELFIASAKQTVPGFFGDLLNAISTHFALEEVLMRGHGYDRLSEHKRDHERLLDEIRDIMDAFENADEIDSVDLAHRLDAWFSRHFVTHDARLHLAFGKHARGS